MPAIFDGLRIHWGFVLALLVCISGLVVVEQNNTRV